MGIPVKLAAKAAASGLTAEKIKEALISAGITKATELENTAMTRHLLLLQKGGIYNKINNMLMKTSSGEKEVNAGATLI
jgi:hypothetical protein